MLVLVTKWFGSFLCDEMSASVRKSVIFEKDAKGIAKKLAAVQRGEILPEELSLRVRAMRVAEPRLNKLGKPVVFDSSFIKPEAYGMDAALMQKVMIELGRLRTREPLPEDKGIAQAIRAIDDLIEAINVASERLHEWYGLYFPELADMARDDEYARLIAELGTREAILAKLGKEMESVGSDLDERDLDVVRGAAASLLVMYERKKALDRYVLEGMERVAPSLSKLLSPNLGARLISLAGGLDRLAKLPASTVQLLGAEKAMFSHLRAGKRPPKHGIIFQHPWVNRAPYWQRGKISRTLGAKAAIAAKVDRFKGEPCGDILIQQMEKRIEEIKKKYPEPPQRGRPRYEGAPIKPRPQHQGQQGGQQRGPPGPQRSPRPPSNPPQGGGRRFDGRR
jgi:nucleolar protein 56